MMMTLNVNDESANWPEFFNLTKERGIDLLHQSKKIIEDKIAKSFNNVWGEFQKNNNLKYEDIKEHNGIHSCAKAIFELAKDNGELFYLVFLVGQFDQNSQGILSKVVMQKILEKF